VATVNRVFTLLRHLVNQAVAWGHMKNSPCTGIEQLREDNTRVRYLTQKVLAQLLEAGDLLASRSVVDDRATQKRGNPWLRPLITVAVNSGPRFAELGKLTWDDVDMDRRTLTLRQTKDGTTARLPFNDEVWLTLTTLRKVAANPHVFPGRGPSGRLDNVQRAFKDALELAGIQDFRFHDLRHTFASHLVMAGVDLNTVRELMHHKTLDMTLRYAHLSPEHQQDALAKIAAISARASAQIEPASPNLARPPESGRGSDVRTT
jgi:integrase